jgi:hypothetical protein
MEERFWRKIEVGDCWEWKAAVDTYGYGSFWRSPAMARAHKVAWELLVGPVPHGLELDHLCRNRRCVNPDHLEPVTHAENARRANAGRRKPVCLRGHDKQGRVGCPECARISNAARMENPVHREANRTASREYARRKREERKAA